MTTKIENLLYSFCLLGLFTLPLGAQTVSPLSRPTTPATTAPPQAFVPGTGTPIAKVGDDFEDPQWDYDYRLPKVYNDKETTIAHNGLGGISNNQRWYEGSKRGQPDLIRRVPTPTGGLPGSQGSLAIRSLRTGSQIPTYQQQQDDFIGSIADRIGKIPVSRSPSVVTRIWLPPWEQWEQRTGCHFAFRVALETGTGAIHHAGFRRSFIPDVNENWPGFFINLQLQPSPNGGVPQKRAYFWMKATTDGKRIRGPEITQTGWWTLGISLSPDGQVHYYAKPGIEDLTPQDHIASSYPFGKRTVYLRNFFFNVCNGDDGKTWSSQLIIDDPTVFIVR